MNEHSAGYWISAIAVGACLAFFGPIIVATLVAFALGTATTWVIARVLGIK